MAHSKGSFYTLMAFALFASIGIAMGVGLGAIQPKNPNMDIWIVIVSTLGVFTGCMIVFALLFMLLGFKPWTPKEN